MDQGTLDMTKATTQKNKEVPDRRKLKVFIYSKMQQTTTHLECTVNDAVEETIMEYLTFILTKIYNNMKHDMYLLIHMVFIKILKCLTQALIDMLAAISFK